MDNFEFDLQLFGNDTTVLVNLTSVKEELTTATTPKAYVVTNGVGSWETYTELPEGAVATLVNGTLSVAVGTEDTVKSIQLTGVTEDKLAGVKVAALSALSDGTAKETAVYIEDADDSIKAKVLQFTEQGIVASDAGVTVDSKGVITVEAGKTFAVYDSLSDTQPTNYSVGANTESKVNITVSGDMAGAYAGVTLEGAKITLQKDAADTVSVDGEAVTPATFASALNWTPVESTIGTSETKYYAVKLTDGALTINNTAGSDNDAIGYIAVKYDKDFGDNPSVTMSFVKGLSTDESSEDSVLLTPSTGAKPIVIDATNLATINGAGVKQITVGSDIPGVVQISNVPSTADVKIGTKDYTDDHAASEEETGDKNVVTYTTTYDVSTTACTIDLSGLGTLSDDDVKYFNITHDTAASTGHGKKLYAIGGSDGAGPTGSNKDGCFKVTYTSATKTYTVSFVAGDGTGEPKDLTAAGWSGIKIDATNLPADGVLIIDSVDDNATTDTSNDNYSVTGAVVGLDVQLAAPADGTVDNSTLSVTRTDSSTKTTITVSGMENGISLATAGTKYYWVSKGVDSKGYPTITLTQKEAAPTDSSSYLTVTNVGGANGTVTITYTNTANIALTGLTTPAGAAAKVLLDNAGLEAGATIVLTDTATNAKVDYTITNLAAGVTVTGADIGTETGKDTVTHAEAVEGKFSNNIEITLPDEPAAGTTEPVVTYYAVSISSTADDSTGLKSVTATAVAEADKGDNYFTVSYANGVYTVAYVPSTDSDKKIDLNENALTGKTTIHADKVDSTSGIVLPASNDSGDYFVDKVVLGGLDKGIKQGTDAVDNNASIVEYATTGTKLADNAGFALVTTTIWYQVTSTTDKGYTIYGVTTGTTTAPTDNKSYIKVSYDSEKKAAKVEFVEGSSGVKYVDFADASTTPLKVDASALPSDAVSLELTEDANKHNIEYAVTGLPASVTTVTNVTAGEDTYTYTSTYCFADGKNALALSKTQGVMYYEVTAGDPDKGVYTCSIGEGKAIESDQLDTLKAKNYFKAVTDENGNVSVTYHVAEIPAGATTPPVQLALDTPKVGATDALTVAVDPTGAAAGTSTAGVTFTFGESSGATLKYEVNDLSRYQTAALATGANDTIDPHYATSYELSYDGSVNGSIALTKTELEAGAPVYYQVEPSNPTAQGVITFTINKTASSELDKTKAYFQVTYKSKYVVSVTYVNPAGAGSALTLEGVPQVVIDANGLAGTTVDTIDVADTTGGQYNGVNYALTNVPSAVSVINTNEGDTVSKKTAAVLADGATLNLDSTAEVMYYTVTSSSTDSSGNAVCNVSKTGTKTKPADTVNYFTVTKNSSAYTLSYHMAEGEGGLGLSSSSKLTMNAAGVTLPVSETADTSTGSTTFASSPVTIDCDTTAVVTVNITEAKGNISKGTNVASISYTTDNFAWEPGVYYLKVKKDTESTISALATDGTSGVTEPGSADTYAKVTVTKISTGTGDDKKDTYKVVIGTNYEVAADTTGAMGDTNTKVTSAVNKQASDLTLELAAGITNLDANSEQFKAITGVTKGDVLKNVYDTTSVTTESLTSGDTVEVDGVELTSGGGVLVFDGAGKVTSGTILLTEAEDQVTESGTGNQYVKLESAVSGTKAGVTVTFEGGKIASITGLDDGDVVTVYNSDNSVAANYKYTTVDGNTYIRKYNGTTASYAITTNASSLNLLDMEFSETTTVKVGQTFTPATAGTYYIATTSTSEASLATTAASVTDAASGQTYVKATVLSGTSNTLELSVVKGNTLHLVDADTTYSGTITVPGSLYSDGVITYVGTKDATDAADSAYKVAFTGVKTGSKFTNLDADDTITTAELAADEAINITYATNKTGETATKVDAVYTAYGTDKQVMTFKGNALTSGTVKLTSGSASLVAADGTTIKYTASGSGNAIVTFGADGITSITQLAANEEVTLTATDGTVTKYKATSLTSITRTVTDKDGNTVTTTLTATGDSEANQSNILQATEGTDNKIVSNFSWTGITASKGTSGYFYDSTGATVSRAFAVAAQTNAEIPITDGMVVMKAEASYVDANDTAKGYTLTLTPQLVKVTKDSEGNTVYTYTDVKAYGDTVTVTAPTGPLTYEDTTKGFKVDIQGVNAGSNITTAVPGDKVSTAALGNTATDKITVNGKTFVSGTTSNTINLYVASKDDVQINSGNIIITGSINSEDGGTKKTTVSYTAGDASKSQEIDGVAVAFTAGIPSGITDLNVGESVQITKDSVVTTYTAAAVDPSNASTKTVIWRNVTGSATSTDNGIKVKTVDNGTEVYSTDWTGWTDVVETKEAFSTKVATGATVADEGYFVVDSITRTATIADVADTTVISTYQDVGKTVVKASLATDGTLTLTKASVGITGAISGSSAFTANDVESLTINVSDKQAIKYKKQTGIESVTLNGVGSGSVFTDFASTDTVSTGSLDKGATIKFNTTSDATGKTYTAGQSGTMSFKGDAVVAGVFDITAFTGTNKFTTTNTNDSTKVSTASELVYTAGTESGQKTDGVFVTVSNGFVTKVTGLGYGESVTYDTTTTAKDGSTSIKNVTYAASAEPETTGANKGKILVTKTETVDGATTTYEKYFANNSDTADISIDTGWTVTGAETKNNFNFGETGLDSSSKAYTTTGYFLATLVTTPSDSPELGKYQATVVPATVETTLTKDNAGIYLMVTASKGTAGDVSISTMKLMELKSTGVWAEVTGKELGTVTVTAPTADGTNITFAKHTFPLAITAGANNSTFDGLGADDTVVTNAALGAGKTLTVNSKKYKAPATGSTVVSVKGDTIVSGTIVLEANNTLIASKDGAEISYTAGTTVSDGVTVEFTAGAITSIKGLTADEKVTVVSGDTTTVYAFNATTSKYTKTITTGDKTVVWTDATTPATATDGTAVITGLTYGVSDAFAWPTENNTSATGYFKVDAGTSTATMKAQTGSTVTMAATEHMVRATVTKSGTKYTLTSVQLLEGTNLTDVSSAEGTTVVAPAYKLAVSVPADSGMTFEVAADAVALADPVTATNVTYRNVAFSITDVQAGQTITGLDERDEVSTANLEAGESFTLMVGKTAVKYAAAEAGSLTVKGDGTAYNGGFALGKSYSISAKDKTGVNDVEITMSSGDAMAVIVGGNLQSIYKLSDGETVTVKTTTSAGVVSTTTYAKAKGVVTRATVSDGATVYETATVADGEDAMSADYEPSGTNNKIVGQLIWKDKKSNDNFASTGYFLATAVTNDDGEVTGFKDAVNVAEESKATTITSKDKGKLYLKVSSTYSYDEAGKQGYATITAIQPYLVSETGTLTDEGVGSASTFTGTVNLTAPEGIALNLNTIGLSVPANVAVNITNAEAGSNIVLQDSDSLATATMAANAKVTVNGTDFTAGAQTAMKFVAANGATATTGAVLKDGTVKVTTTGGGIVAAGADGTAGAAGTDTDNITIAATGSDAVVTVTNGVVTGVSGQTAVNSSVTVAPASGGAAYITYDLKGTDTDGDGSIDANKHYDVTTTATDVTLAALTKDANVTVGTPAVTYTSGADNNSIVLKGGKFQEGVLGVAGGGSLTANGADTTVATDDVVVDFTDTGANGDKAVVTVKNGMVTGISGLGAGDIVKVTEKNSDATKQVVTTYTMNANGTQVTKSRQVGTYDAETNPPTVTTAYISNSGDLLTANYFSSTADTTDTLTGQLNWSSEVGGRSAGYFKLASKTNKEGATTYSGTIAEQAVETPVTPVKNGTVRYLLANVDNGTLTIDAFDVTNVTNSSTKASTTTIKTLDVTDADAATAAKFTSADKITITAPTDQAITYDKGLAGFAVTLNKVAAGSTIQGLDAGDTVNTNTLEAGQRVMIGGVNTSGTTTYYAGAKGTLTFVGEGNGKETTPTNTKAALLTGTIALGVGAGNVTTAYLAGSDADGLTDDIEVAGTLTSDTVVLKVAKGQITSLKGLETAGDTLTLKNVSGKITVGKETVEYTNANIVYEVISAGTSSMIRRRIFTDGTTGTAGVYDAGTDTLKSESFLTVASGGEVYTGKYQAADGTDLSDLSFAATEKTAKTYGYYDYTASTINPGDADATSLIDATTAAGLGYTVTGGQFTAVPNRYYLKVTSTTNKNGATISGVELMQAGATGKLVAVKNQNFYGTLTIDGTKGMAATGDYDAKYAVVNVTMPKNGTYDLLATNISYKSTITNLGDDDVVSTADLATATELKSGTTYNLYHAVDTNSDAVNDATETRKVVVKGKDIKATIANGAIATLVGLDDVGETVTITETTAAGTSTTVLTVSKAGELKKTVTTADGIQTVQTATGLTGTTEVIALVADPTKWTDSTAAKEATKVVSDFDWTLAKAATGYFAVKNGAATAKVQKTTITDGTASYIAVTLSDTAKVTAAGGISYKTFDAANGAMANASSKFSGTINVTAPTGRAFALDRGTALDATTIDTDSTKLAITGVAAGSALTDLATGDTVTTAKLGLTDSVTITQGTDVGYYQVAKAGTLGFKVDSFEIDGVGEYDNVVTITSGTALLSWGTGNNSDGYLFVGRNLIEYTGGGTANDGITVTASKNGASFTIGDLDENETFTVNGVTYQKSGSTILRTYTDANTGLAVNEIYAVGKGTSLTSDIINKTANWKSVNETLATDDAGNRYSKYGIVNVNLATAASRYNADKKANLIAAATAGGTPTNYDYVLDKYVSSTTKESIKNKLDAAVVAGTGAAGWQEAVGEVTVTAILNEITGAVTYTYLYDATKAVAGALPSAVAQAITVAANWSIKASAGDDTIKGASSGENAIDLTAGGNDSVTLGGATETVSVDVSAGRTEISNFSAKDALVTSGEGANFKVQLTKAGDVYLFNDTDTDGVYDTDEKGVTLKKASGVAVNWNGKTTYFGKEDGKAGSFTYVEDAYYYANSSGKNTLNVNTDKTKATAKTLGDDVVIDLTSTKDNGDTIYTNIQTVNASKSGNRVVLTASATGSNLTGGTYESTLKAGAGNDTLTGGSGKDVFWFDDLNGTDQVKSCTSGKDSIYLGGESNLTTNYTIKADGTNVVITKTGDDTSKVTIAGAVNPAKALSVSTDGVAANNSGTTKTTVDYYVGKSGSKVSNTFTYVDGAYYIGNADTTSATADTKYLDLLKVTGSVTAAPTAVMELDMNNDKYQSIEAVDASGRKAGKGVTDTSKLGINVTANGTYGSRITGTIYNDTITCGAKSDYIIYNTKQKDTDTIDQLGVGDVIQLNGLSKSEIATVQSKLNSIASSGSGNITFSGGGTLKFTNVTADMNLTIDSKGKVTATAKA